MILLSVYSYIERGYPRKISLGPAYHNNAYYTRQGIDMEVGSFMILRILITNHNVGKLTYGNLIRQLQPKISLIT